MSADNAPLQLTQSFLADSIAATSLIDALPYIDNDYVNNQSAVDALIQEECQHSHKTVEDYLADVCRKYPQMNAQTAADTADYEFVKPKTPSLSEVLSLPPSATLRDQLIIRYQHERQRSQYIRSLTQSGAADSESKNAMIESKIQSAKQSAVGVQTAIYDINRKRKAAHIAVGNTLASCQHEWMSTIAKRRQIRDKIQRITHDSTDKTTT